MPKIANGDRPSADATQVVLVVEDEELVRNFMRRVLAEAGYDVVSASNGQDAITMLRSLAVDLVITDIRMPGMDGRELGRLISNLAQAPPLLYARPATIRLPGRSTSRSLLPDSSSSA
jgi:CheY-like chemotaxis protein